MSQTLEVVSNIVTPFAADGSLDEAALRAQVDRTAQAGVGVFANTPGSGACHSLSFAEYGRVCEISVEAAGGRVPVYAMTPELHDVELMLEHARAAASAGVDEVQLFQLMGGHGMKATRDEQLLYWRTCLRALEHPVAVSVHAIAGYSAPPDLLAGLCEEFAQIRTVYTYGTPNSYVAALREQLPERIRVGGHILNPGPTGLALGMSIITGAEPNVIPRTARGLIDGYRDGDAATLGRSAARIQRLQNALKPWGSPNSRSLYMALRVLGLPGGGGTVRPPLVEPPAAELETLAAALDGLGVREWER